MRQNHPNRQPHRARKMRHRGIHGDHHIERCHQGRRLGKIAARRARIHQQKLPDHATHLSRRRTLLQREPRNPWNLCQRQQRPQRHRPAIVALMFRIPRPCHSHPQPLALPSQPRGFYFCISGAHIREPRRNRLNRPTKCQRQTHQRAMPRKYGQRFAAFNDPHTSNVHQRMCQQPFQRRLHLQHNPSAALGDQRNIANKLQRVPQSLLRVEQNRLPMQSLTPPLWLREVPPAQAQLAKVPSPLMLPPALFEPSLTQISEPEIIVATCAARIELHRPLVMAKHPRTIAQPHQHVAKIRMSRRVFRFEINRTPVARGSLLIAPLLEKRVAQAAVVRRLLLFESQHAAKTLLRASTLPKRHPGISQIMVRRHGLRIESQSPLVAPRRAPRLPQHLQRIAKIAPGLCVLRTQLKRLAATQRCLRKRAFVIMQIPQAQQRFRKSRPQMQRLLIGTPRLSAPPGRCQCRSERIVERGIAGRFAKRRPIHPDGLIDFALPAQEMPQRFLGPARTAFETRRFFPGPSRIVLAPSCHLDVTKTTPGSRQSGPQLQSPAAPRLRILQIPRRLFGRQTPSHRVSHGRVARRQVRLCHADRETRIPRTQLHSPRR